MPEVRFGFETPERLSGELAYAREPDGGGQLELSFTSPRLRRADGSDKWFTLGFNNIGPTDPLVFLESLDQGYLNDKLTNLFPKTATREGRQKFFEDVQSVAGELGYSTDELRGVTDHRLFALAHWAKVGMDAAKAREKAQAKVEKAPPATPRKPGQGAATANRNAEAMRKLGRTGSIKDALAIDWD